MYIIRDREAGNEIECVSSYTEAKEILSKFEADDRKDCSYTPDFYEIVEVDENGDVVRYCD